jgi:chorismate mutase
VKAIRGATTVPENSAPAIDQATCELIQEIARRNQLAPTDLISVFFTLTPDLTAAFPARAARSAGWDVPMLDMVEVDVLGAMPRCIRILVHAECVAPVRHVYLREAAQLRPDLEKTP